jgi:hypothetical protein
MSVKAGLLLVLALVAVPVPAPQANENQRPFSCRLLTDEQKKSASRSCDQRTIERLWREPARRRVGREGRAQPRGCRCHRMRTLAALRQREQRRLRIRYPSSC